MKKFLTYAAPALTLLGLTLGGCQVDITEPKASAGGVDVSKYISVGNSLTAGFADNGLYLEGQQSSYPALLAGQFAQVGGGSFVQPLFPAAQFNGSGYLSLTGFDATGTPKIVPVTTDLAVTGMGLDQKTPLLVRYAGTDNQNLGVPGIRVADVTTPGYGLNNPIGFNPYFERLLPAGSPTTYLAYVQERVTTVKPTFFTDWLGNNDVLGFATSGGVAPLTSVAEFSTKYAQVVDALTSGGAKGLVANIPSVTNLPFFTTVPTAALIGRVAGAPVPQAVKDQLTDGLQLTPAQAATIRFGLFIKTGAGAVREATAADLILLPASALISAPSVPPGGLPGGFGIIISGLAPIQAGGLALALPPNALPNGAVLDSKEVADVTTRTSELNNVISSNAQRKDLALFDTNSFFTQVARTGLIINGVNNTTSFITGNLFSLDGVHPTPRGYAVIANEMIKTINYKYGASIPGIDATHYRGVKFP